MNDDSPSTGKATLLWIAVLPGAIVAAYLANLLFMITYQGSGEPGIIHHLLGSLLYGGVFVYTSYRIAPYHENIVATVFAAIVLLLSGMSLTGMLERGGAFPIIALVALNIGSIGVCIYAWNDELD